MGADIPPTKHEGKANSPRGEYTYSELQLRIFCQSLEGYLHFEFGGSGSGFFAFASDVKAKRKKSIRFVPSYLGKPEAKPAQD